MKRNTTRRLTTARRLRLYVAACIGLASGCSGPTMGPLQLYDGPVLSHDEVALLDWQTGGGRVLRVDDRVVDEGARQAAVLPGWRTIQYMGTFGGSVMRGPAVRRVGPLIAQLELRAGHVYVVQAERRGDWSSPFLYLWIADAATGEVLHGEKPR